MVLWGSDRRVRFGFTYRVYHAAAAVRVQSEVCVHEGARAREDKQQAVTYTAANRIGNIPICPKVAGSGVRAVE